MLKDCPDSLIPLCDVCIDENHFNHANKSVYIFCENLDKLVTQKIDANKEFISTEFEQKI